MSARLNTGADGRLALVGELNFASAMPLKGELQRALAATRGTVTLDLSGVTHSNSVGLSLILMVSRITSARGQDLQVVAMPEGLHSIARACELDDWLLTMSA